MQCCYFNSGVLAGYWKIALLACTFLIAQDVFAHGYISQPESRSYKCKLGKNTGCGGVIWEPQSVEGRDRFPETGPRDGKLASAETSFSQLDEQTFSRWHKTRINSGANRFTWTFTAPHQARDFRYFITKPGWNANAKLARSAFDLQPFCSVIYGQRPPWSLTHDCVVPPRSGYHVILAVWDVADTGSSFYQAIDVEFTGAADPVVDARLRLKDIGDINPSTDLSVGDKARTRLFTQDGEITGSSVEIVISGAAQGQRNMWPAALARAINSANTNGMRAGQRNQNGTVMPVSGKNDIFVPAGSSLARVEVEIIKAPAPVLPASIDIRGLQSIYTINNAGDSLRLGFEVASQGQLDAEYQLFNAQNTQVAQGVARLDNSSIPVTLMLNNVATGDYSLVVIGKSAQGTMAQNTLAFKVQLRQRVTPPVNPGSYQHRFPQGLSSYQAGTVVLQPKNGKTYRCKPWPYNGFCRQWSATASQFEPGVGSHWSLAWEQI